MASADTFGQSIILFTPDPNVYSIVPTASVAGGWTWPLSYFGAPLSQIPNIAAVQASFEVARVVSFGIKAYTPQPITSAAGIVHICNVPLDYAQGMINFVPTSVAQMATMPGYITIPLADLIEDESFIILPITDYSGATRYRDLIQRWAAATPPIAGLENSPGFMGTLVVVTGSLAAASALNFELIWLAEGLVKPASVYEGLPPAASSPIILSAISNMCASIAPNRVLKSDRDSTDRFWQDASNLLDAGIKVAQGVLPVLGAVASFVV
jgi:hypothetical protein